MGEQERISSVLAQVLVCWLVSIRFKLRILTGSLPDQTKPKLYQYTHKTQPIFFFAEAPIYQLQKLQFQQKQNPLHASIQQFTNIFYFEVNPPEPRRKEGKSILLFKKRSRRFDHEFLNMTN